MGRFKNNKKSRVIVKPIAKKNQEDVSHVTGDKIPKSFVFSRMKLPGPVKQLQMDLRKLMLPYTALNLKEKKRNTLRDFLNVSGPMGVTHFLMLSKTASSLSLRVARTPQGPTLTFKIHQYSLASDIAQSQLRPRCPPDLFKSPPLIVLSGFGSQELHLKLATIMFQNIFPSIDINTVKLSTCQRLVLLNYNKDTKLIDFRHYSIRLQPVGVSRRIRKFVQNHQVPDLRNLQDVSDFVTKDNAKFCSCGGDRQVYYWDVSTGRVIRKFRGHDGEVNAVKFNDSSSVVVSAGFDRSLRVWDCRSHSVEPVQIIDTFLDTVMSVVLTKTEIIGGSVDGTVRTFDMRIGREMSDNLGQPVNCISISNDGNCVLAGCLDSTLRLLDRTTGELLQVYKGHMSKSFKTDCCLTNSDAHVIGGSEDGLVFFWDLVDAKVVSKFRAHDLVVTSVSYHPKEDCMLTSSVDGTVRVWKK